MDNGLQHESPNQASSSVAESAFLPPMGDVLGNCRIHSVIGEGGIGIVYKAFEQDVEMERALKVLKPNQLRYLRDKFQSEANVTARLIHPNIVLVHGGGIYSGELPFIAMQPRTAVQSGVEGAAPSGAVCVRCCARLPYEKRRGIR